MRFFKAIKNTIRLIRLKKRLNQVAKETNGNEKRYLDMPANKLVNLSDDELFIAVSVRTENKVSSFDDTVDGLNSLNLSQRIFYSVNWFEMEVNNGGLCQFFVNSSRAVAPFVSEYMGIIGAVDHKKLFDDFISKCGIDLNDLSSFDIEDIEEFEEQNQRYPFDEYDSNFYNTEPLDTFLKCFIRERIKDFL